MTATLIVPKVKVHPQTSLEFSRIIYGTWRILDSKDPATFTPEAVAKRIEYCVSLGITTFDLADIYGGGAHQAEKCFGAGLRLLKPEVRSQIQLVTKCDIRFANPSHPDVYAKHYDTSKAYILKQVQDSLEAVGVSYFDCLLIHRPDPLMDADEVSEAMRELKQAGQVHFFGVSNFSASQVDLLQSRLDFPLITNQIELSVLHTAPLFDGTLEQAQRLRMVPMIWSPLAGGKIFSNSTDTKHSTDLAIDRVQLALKKVAKQLGEGVTIDQVAYAWVLRHPSRPLPIVGSNDVKRIRVAADALKLKMDRQQWFTILEAQQGKETP